MMVFVMQVVQLVVDEFCICDEVQCWLQVVLVSDVVVLLQCEELCESFVEFCSIVVFVDDVDICVCIVQVECCLFMFVGDVVLVMMGVIFIVYFFLWEIDVLVCVVLGLINVEIVFQFGFCEGIVKVYLGMVMFKFDVLMCYVVVICVCRVGFLF